MITKKKIKIPMMLKIGDKVAVLDEDLEGTVVKTDGTEVHFETAEGFILRYEEADLVKLEGKLKNVIPDPTELSQVIEEKERPKKRRIPRSKPREKNIPPMEVDLHIGKLTRSTRGMSNYDILNLQMEVAQRQLDFAVGKRIQKIVFIHGVGEGVLKAELETLFSRYENLKWYDADYQKYGLGATEVYIFQNY